MRYYELTDANRRGEIIREDGRKHYRFSFGPFQWERTTAFQSYITEGCTVYGQYRQIDEQTAQSLLLERGKKLSRDLEKAEKLASAAHASQYTKSGRPYLEHIREVVDILPDWEEKIAGWLREICAWGGRSAEQLHTAGFTDRICTAVGLLTMSADEPFGSYLAKLRGNRIARRVKIADLGCYIDAVDAGDTTDEVRLEAEQCREARKYLFGDIAQYSNTHDIRLLFAPDGNLIPADRLFQSIFSQALGGRKIPHGVSNPMLRRHDGHLSLAFFVYTYTRSQLQQGMIGRPVSWIVADIRTGKLLAEIPCSSQDFSAASNEVLYSVHNPNPRPEADSFKETYAMLDEVRREYLEKGIVQSELYDAYLERILHGVPPAYHRFYRELSNL